MKARIKNQVSSIKKWIKTNPREATLLALILLTGAFLRLYRIDEYMTFLGDEGRDVIVVRRLLVNADPILIGPGTSIGDMYLGPLYYYMMAPALLLAGFSPVGPAVQIALLGVATTFFIWRIGREWFPGVTPGQASVSGLVAAALYAISPTVIIYSRSSWNPNIMPFFALLCIYAIWRVWQWPSYAKSYGGFPEAFREGGKWLIVAGVSFAFVLQSHYLGLLLAPVILFFWFLTVLRLRVTGYVFNIIKNPQHTTRNRLTDKQTRSFIKYSVVGLGLFLLLMSPLVIFDARHGWRNFASVKKFFTERQTTVSARPWNALPKAWPNFVQINTRLIAGHNETVGLWISAAMVVLLVWLVFTRWRKIDSLIRNSYFLILVWLGFALLGLSLYKQHIYDHYYGFFFAAPFLLLGALAQNTAQGAKNKGKIIVFVSAILLLIANLRNNPLKNTPNRQLQRSREVAGKMVEEAREKKFNMAVIAERNYEGAYQYFLEKAKTPLVMIDPQRADETITEQLFVVCELPEEKCDPTHNPKAGIANFGWSKIEEQWDVAGVVLYKLVHTQ